MTLPTGLLSALDDLVRTDLQDIRQSFFVWLLRSTAVVAIGVILEGPETIRELSEEIERFLFRLSRQISINPVSGLPFIRHRLKWRLLIAAAGWVLIGVGVVGEFGFEIGVSKYDALIQSFDSLLIKQARLESAEADEHAEISEQKAGEANERAAALGITLERERQKTAGYQRENIAAQTSLAERLTAAQASAAKSAADLEIEKKKRLELAASLLPREFFDQSGAISILASFPQMHVVFKFPDEREPRRIAEQINFALGAVGWNTWRRRGDEDMLRDGIFILVGAHPVVASVVDKQTDEEFRKQEAIGKWAEDALRQVVERCGSNVEATKMDPEFPPNTLVIEVGPKPNHALENALEELGPPPTATKVQGFSIGGNRAFIRDEGEVFGKKKAK